ncbi:MAG TPA: hypothetical protein VGG39_31000 [Polyangiaceae bacterium]|jgi:hypothetical protein
MAYEGRSPIKDVVRSVVMGAAMISPALLAHCTEHPATTPPIPLDPTGAPTSGGIPSAAVSANVAGTTTSTASAPPNDVVRPRTAPTGQMPTRGFAGAVRARG